MEITFIHAADLHLGRAFIGLKHLPDSILKRLEDSAYRSLERIVTNAINHNVDFVLFAGDVFDEKSGSLRAQIRFKKQLERLDDYSIRVFLCHGNHDPLSDYNLSIAYPESVHVFESEQVTSVPFYKNGKSVARIYGFSYTSKKVLDNKTVEYIKNADALYHIGMLHGNVEGHVGHDPYAPFAVSELIEKGFDYWALGHIHKREVLVEVPPVVYPGNIQGMHMKESGEKGCMLVKLSEKGTYLTFIPTADIIWRESEISIINLQTIDDLLTQLEEVIEKLRQEGTDTFLRLHLTGSGALHDVLQSTEQLNDLLEHLQEGEEEKRPFVWITNMNVATKGEWDRDELKQQPHFIGELLRTIDTYNFTEEALNPLTNHLVARRYLELFSEEEKQEIETKAEMLLLSELIKGR